MAPEGIVTESPVPGTEAGLQLAAVLQAVPEPPTHVPVAALAVQAPRSVIRSVKHKGQSARPGAQAARDEALGAGVDLVFVSYSSLRGEETGRRRAELEARGAPSGRTHTVGLKTTGSGWPHEE